MVEKSFKSGFTIVELLIVIVVIAILAALSLVSYNGITSQARHSQVQSEVSAINKKLLLKTTLDSERYPESISDLDITLDDQSVYTYYADNYSSKDYCLSISRDDASYHQTSSLTVPSEGKCEITNYATNPSVDTFWVYHSRNLGWGIQDIQPTITQFEQRNDGGFDGSKYFRGWWTSNSTGNAYMLYTTTIPTPGKWCLSLYARSTQNINSGLIIIGTQDNTYMGLTRSTSTIPLTAGVWTRLPICFEVTDARINRITARIGVGNTPVAGTTVDVDAAMLTRGDTLYTYADGEHPDWTWTGARYDSPSSGVPY